MALVTYVFVALAFSPMLASSLTINNRDNGGDCKDSSAVLKTHKHVEKLEECPLGFVGTLPNRFDCRGFYNCNDGWGSLLACPEYLLYNNSTNNCDYPPSANCCEFWELNISQIVADGVFI